MKGSPLHQYLAVWVKLKSMRRTGKLACGRAERVMTSILGFVAATGCGCSCFKVTNDTSNCVSERCHYRSMVELARALEGQLSTGFAGGRRAAARWTAQGAGVHPLMARG